MTCFLLCAAKYADLQISKIRLSVTWIKYFTSKLVGFLEGAGKKYHCMILRADLDLRYLHWQNLRLLFSLLFCLQCSLVLLFYRNIDFGTKYPREDEDETVKLKFVHLLEVSDISKWGTRSVVKVFIYLLLFFGEFFVLVDALCGCFDCSSPVCFVDAMFDIKLVLSPPKSKIEKPEVWDECCT